MTTPEIITDLDAMRIADSEDYKPLERIDELMDELKQNKDAANACTSIINLLERHPDVEFGTPGEPVHTLERYAGHYEPLLLASLERQPALMTVWMLNRMINGATGNEQKILVEKMKAAAVHPAATDAVKNEALDFLAHQSCSRE